MINHTETAPNITIVRINLENILQVLDGGGKLLHAPEDARDGLHSRDRPIVVAQGMVVALTSAVKVAHHLREVA